MKDFKEYKFEKICESPEMLKAYCDALVEEERKLLAKELYEGEYPVARQKKIDRNFEWAYRVIVKDFKEYKFEKICESPEMRKA